MPKLTDTQSLLLAHAARGQDGSLYPLPASLADGQARTSKAIAALVKRGLVEERETAAPAQTAREDGDLRYGAFITTAGLTAIGVVDEAGSAGKMEAAPVSSSAPGARTSKIASVLALLGRDDGATLPELVEATGWLPHTTRAALTGLRKKGHALERSKRDEVTCYRLVEAR